MLSDDRCDVPVIGGGSSGSSIAAARSALYRDMILLNRPTYPCSQVGASLLPMNVLLFARLGVAG